MIGEGLGLVDLLHLSGVTVLGGEDEQRGINQLVGNGNLLNVAAQVRLVPIGEGLVHLLELLDLLLGNLIAFKYLNVLFGDGLDLALLVLTEVLRSELIDRVIEEQNLVALSGVLLEDRGAHDGVLGVAREVKDGVLVVLHAADVLIEGHPAVWLLGRVESEKLGKLAAVGRVFNNAKFDVLAK